MKNITKILSATIIGLNLFSVPASAGTWIQHEGYDLSLTNGVYKGGWEYELDTNKKAMGWHQIDNKWYYFYPEDGCAATGITNILNKDYFFNPDTCELETNKWVRTRGITLWVENDGSINYSKTR